MKRVIRTTRSAAKLQLEMLPDVPKTLGYCFAPAAVRSEGELLVQQGHFVAKGQELWRGPALSIHAAASGVVKEIRGDTAILETGKDGPVMKMNLPLTGEQVVSVAARTGMVGMGGSEFPSSIKLNASLGVKTLVINAVECEPGIRIDEALLINEGKAIEAGARALAEAVGAERVVLAVKKTFKEEFAKLNLPFEPLFMRTTYPAGAERLIAKKILGRVLPAGVFPFQQGLLVQNTASVWSVGRYLESGLPLIERPLTVVVPDKGVAKNVVVPVGTQIAELLRMLKVGYDPEESVLVAGGMMMGRKVDENFFITKGTNAVFVLKAEHRLLAPEEPCVLCGSCFDVCPLNLHPIGIVERLQKNAEVKGGLHTQLSECFLCGACSAVCPANIPLVGRLKEGKSCLNRK